MIITLSGFMGCGKSTVGKELKRLLPDFSLVDLDEFIEEDAGMSVAEIFRESGEEAFRDAESDALECLLMVNSDKNLILSLGGGTLVRSENAKAVRDNSLNIYLKASVETLVENLEGAAEGRPMLDGGELRSKVEKLMNERASIYEDTAREVILTDGKDCTEIAEEIAELVR